MPVPRWRPADPHLLCRGPAKATARQTCEETPARGQQAGTGPRFIPDTSSVLLTGSTVWVTTSSSNKHNNRRNILQAAASSFARNRPQLGTSWYSCSQSTHWQHVHPCRAPLPCAACVILASLHPSHQPPFPRATSLPASAPSRGSSCPMPFWALFSRRHKPSAMLRRDFQPGAGFPLSFSSLTSTSSIHRGL